LSQETDNEASEKVQLNDDEARWDSGSANKNKLKEGWKSPCLSHFFSIRLSEKTSHRFNPLWSTRLSAMKWWICSGKIRLLN
jgi:hypothetical protein